MAKQEKTNVMRTLERLKIPYQEHFYGDTEAISGVEVAAVLGEDPARTFKTLVTVGKSKTHYVFMVPVAEELDLKKAAAAAGEKSVSMLPQKELLPLTGYVHGGCSPIGMKKSFPTFQHAGAEKLETVCVSGGKVGCQIELKPEDLQRVTGLKYADLTAQRG